MVELIFKSWYDNYMNEMIGLKNNTVRVKPLFEHDERFCILKKLSLESRYQKALPKGNTITIIGIQKNKKFGEITKDIINVTRFRVFIFTLYIITWKSDSVAFNGIDGDDKK